MADVGNRASQESNSSNDDYVNIQNPTPEHSSPEMLEGEEAEEGTPAGDREQIPVDPEVPKPSDEPAFQVPSAGVDDLRKRMPVQPGTATVEAPRAEGYLRFLNVLHPLVLYIIYWNDVKLSAVALVTVLVVLATLCMNTMLHTTVLLLLAATVVSLLYIVIKIAIDSFYNRAIRNPFQSYLDHNEGIPQDEVIELVKYGLSKANCYYRGLVRLVFFANTVSSLKFMIGLFFLSYFTNCLDFITAVTCAVIFLFGAPPLYSRYKQPIDNVIDKIVTIVQTTYCTIYSKLPFLPKTKED